ncbi:unnamed protein product [Closterium sp. NIES-65]|nr:unnamed protein product [Closterium sp. NIES-65]
MDVWGPARVRGQGHERYFLLVIDDYSRYTTVFPLCRKGEVTEVLIDWICAARRQLSEIFGSDLPVLRLHSDRGGEFSSDLLQAFCRAEGIRQTFTLPTSPQQNGIAERRIGMVMDVAHTSMIHAAAPHFLWPFAVQYAAHQINLQPRVSLPETTPTLRWTGKVGDASAFRVWGSRAFVCDSSADKLSSRAIPCVFLGFPTDAPEWQFYQPTSRCVLSSQDITFEESVPCYRLFPYRTAPLPPLPLFLAPGPPPVNPLPPQGPAPSGVSKVDAVEPVEVAVDYGAARGAEPAGAGSGGAEPERAEPGGAESGGAEPGRVEVFRVLRPRGSHSLHSSCASGLLAARAVLLELVVLQALEVLLLLELLVPEVLVLEVLELLGLVELLEQVLLEVLGLEVLALLGLLVVLLELELLEVLELEGLQEPVLLWVLDLALLEQLEVLLELVVLLELELPFGVQVLSLLVLEALRGRGRTTFRSFSRFLSDSVRAASTTVTHLLATVVNDPSFESTAASALVAELVDFAAHCRLDYAASLVAESKSVCPPSVGDLLPDIKDEPLRVLVHVATQRDYELHSLDFNTAFLQGSLHEEIWLRHPPGFTGPFPPGTQWSLRRQVYGLHQAPREWHDTLSTTLAALGFAPSTADRSLFLRTDTSLPPFYILVYVDDLVFATADTEGLAHVKSELQNRHACTDLGELRSYLRLHITRDRARRTITFTQSHMVQQVLQRFNFTYSSPQATVYSPFALSSAFG